MFTQILCTLVQLGSSIVTATRCMVMCMCVCSQAKLGGLEVVIDIGEFDQQWQRVAGQQFSMQNTLFVPHDFAVSESYYIFFYSDTTFELVSHCLPDGACIMQDLQIVWEQLCKQNRWCCGLHVCQLDSSHTHRSPVMQCIVKCAATAADSAADYHRLHVHLPIAIEFHIFRCSA